MTLPFIKPQKGSDIVMEHIQKQIESGEYMPGQRLPTVVQYAEIFQVGRSTIREALSGLKAKGLLTIRHGGGTFVVDVLPAPDKQESSVVQLFNNAAELKEVIEVRQYIEAGCAALAAARRTEKDLEKLQQALKQMSDSIGDEQKSEEADILFHLQLAHASHNSLFISMMESMTERLQASMKDSRRLWYFADRTTAEALLAEHQRIYEAVREQQAELAADLLKQHIQKVNEVALKVASADM